MVHGEAATATPQVSIVIPHYQTAQLTLLCLRLLRLRTAAPPPSYETIVIDNGSRDASAELLERIRWIRLIRRSLTVGERPARSHGLALNLGVAHATAPLILIMHTDTMIMRPDWLDYLVGWMERLGPKTAAVGSWKMEAPNPLQRLGKWLEESCRRLRGRKIRAPRYLRTHCALYRKSALAAYPPMFDPSEHRSAGEELHEAIERAGYHCHFLPPQDLNRYVHHLNHATMALNSHFGRHDPYMPRTRLRALQRIDWFFRHIQAERILADETLDY